MAFYRFRSAHHFFVEAKQILEEIAKLDKGHVAIVIHNSLWLSFYILYAKPFEQQRDKTLKMGLRLPDDLVPPQFKRRHESILHFRDKMFAHTDISGPTTDNGISLNALVLIYVNRTTYHFANAFVHPAPELIPQFDALLDALVEKCDYHAKKIWRRWAKELDLPAGSSWKINVGAEDCYIMEKWGQK